MKSKYAENDSALGAALSVLSAVGFGTLLIFGKLSFAVGLGLTSSLAWRFIGSTAVLWAILYFRKEPRIARRQALYAFFLGALGYAGSSVLFFASLQYISVSLTSLLLYTYPSMVTLIAWATTRIAPTKARCVSLALSLFGSALILNASPSAIDPIGIILGLGAALIYAFYLSVGNVLVRTTPPLTTSAYMCLGAMVSFLLAGLCQNEFQRPNGAWGWLVVLGLVAIATVLPLLSLLEGIRKIGASRASIFSSVEPLISVAFGVWLFGDTLSPIQCLGALFVVSALFVLGWMDRPSAA